MPGALPVLPAPSSTPVLLSRDLQPVFTNQCVIGHSPGGSDQLIGIRMDLRAGQTHASLVNQLSSLDPTRILVVPGDAESSEFFTRIRETMVPGVASLLTAEEIG